MPRHVLLVDDEDDIREVARLSLEMMRGWEVSTAASGEEALRLAATLAPDAILLDVMMPEMDGPTVVQHLHAGEATAEIPVVFLTAKVQGRDHLRFENMGVAGVLSKPFDPMVLGDELADILGWDD